MDLFVSEKGGHVGNKPFIIATKAVEKLQSGLALALLAAVIEEVIIHEVFGILMI